MKAKLKALNVFIGGKVYKIEDNPVFDTEKTPSLKLEIEANIKSGHLVEIGKVEAKSESKAEIAEVEKPKAIKQNVKVQG